MTTPSSLTDSILNLLKNTKDEDMIKVLMVAVTILASEVDSLKLKTSKAN